MKKIEFSKIFSFPEADVLLLWCPGSETAYADVTVRTVLITATENKGVFHDKGKKWEFPDPIDSAKFFSSYTSKEAREFLNDVIKEVQNG